MGQFSRMDLLPGVLRARFGRTWGMGFGKGGCQGKKWGPKGVVNQSTAATNFGVAELAAGIEERRMG